MKTFVTIVVSLSIGALVAHRTDAWIVSDVLQSDDTDITRNVEQANALLDMYDNYTRNAPTLTRNGTNWVLAHVPMPECPNDHKRTVAIPERDEVDALTVSCIK